MAASEAWHRRHGSADGAVVSHARHCVADARDDDHIRGMTPRTSRALVASLVALAVTSLGCGALNQAKNIAEAAGVLGDFADRLGKAATMTYTAEYQVSGGDKVTLVQQPPSAAFIGGDGRFIFTPDVMYLCGEQNGKLSCQKSPNQSGSTTAGETGFAAGVAGPGFVTPELALGLIIAAAVVPGADVSTSEKTVAGQKSLCATVTGLDSSTVVGSAGVADSAASPGEEDAPKDFSVCVTEVGILASFSGTSTSGDSLSVELTGYSETADPAAFAPPAGAEIVDVTQLQPPS
jgi:hypothetical protein